MTKIDTSKPSREFDAWIAENVKGCTVKWAGGEPYCGCRGHMHPHHVPLALCTLYIDAAYEMEESIAERDLWREYAGHLCAVVGHSELQDDGIRVTKADPWNIAHATPLQRCQAAYAVFGKCGIGN